VTNNADITDKKIHHSGYDALQFGPKWLTGYVCRKGGKISLKYFLCKNRKTMATMGDVEVFGRSTKTKHDYNQFTVRSSDN